MLADRVNAVEPAPWALRGDATVLPYRRGCLAFLRYSDSNVGPYDELLWLAPFRGGPGGRAHRVPAIFVSSEASVRGGRENWGFPKQLAEFRVTSLASGEERVEVSSGGQPLASFVRSRPCGGLAFDARSLPPWALRLVQLSEGHCFETVPEGRGRLRLTRVSELRVNEAWLPDAHGSRSRIGLSLSELELRFPAARVFEAA